MPHEIEADRHYVSGESVIWEHTVENDGTAKDLSGGSVEWYLVQDRGDPNSESFIDSTDSDVTAEFTTDGSDGRIDVVIDRDATSELDGMFWQRLIVEDASTGRQIYHGDFPISEQ